MKKILLFTLVSLVILMPRVYSISLDEYITHYGMPQIYNGTLDLSDQGLTDITGLHNIVDINQVRILYLQDNQLKIIPDTVFNGLHNLEYLDLDNNQLKILPTGIFNGLNNLKTLCLRNNQLKTLPETLFSDLSSLQKLYLSDNQLQVLPATIFNILYKLQTLDLVNNQLKILPETLFNGLDSLQSLLLDGNHLVLLPAAVFKSLHNLYLLYLSKNQLQVLPATIFCDLPSLQFLDLRGNAFKPDFMPMLADIIRSIPGLVSLNNKPKDQALAKQPFVTLKQMATEKIAKEITMYGHKFHTLPLELLNLFFLTKEQKTKIEHRSNNI